MCSFVDPDPAEKDHQAKKYKIESRELRVMQNRRSSLLLDYWV